jgi:hypothetical protein
MTPIACIHSRTVRSGMHVAGGRGEVETDRYTSHDEPDGRREECCWLTLCRGERVSP